MPSISYSVIRSARRTTAIQIMPDGSVVVRCPRAVPDSQIRAVVESKASWIEKKLAHPKPQQPILSNKELRALAVRAAEVIKARVAHFAPIVGVEYGRITIRHQRTRWGSCSAKGNLNFNCLLVLAPPQVLDYVVVHELCHCRELNHSRRFWAEVKRVLPGYVAQRKWLKENGTSLITRLPPR